MSTWQATGSSWGQPPDHRGMHTNVSSVWVQHDGYWYRASRSAHRTQLDLDACDTWEEVIAFGVVEESTKTKVVSG